LDASGIYARIERLGRVSRFNEKTPVGKKEKSYLPEILIFKY
jgi:hypothetical protein